MVVRIAQRVKVIGKTKKTYFNITMFYIFFVLIPIFSYMLYIYSEAFDQNNKPGNQVINISYKIFKLLIVVIVLELIMLIIYSILLCISTRDYTEQYHDQIELRD